MRARSGGTLFTLGAAWAASAFAAPSPLAAQTCSVPAEIAALAPDAPAPRPLGGWPQATADTRLGVGHVRRSPEDPVPDLPPGMDDWLSRAALPLHGSPVTPAAGALLNGWIVGEGAGPRSLPTEALLETGYEEPSFVVLEERDGWLRLRLGADGPDPASAWVPACALASGPILLAYEPWADWLLTGEIAPLHFRVALPRALRAEPADGGPATRQVRARHALEPAEVRGDWMRVTLKEPSDYCDPDATPIVTVGWIRWREPGLGPLVWYPTRGC